MSGCPMRSPASAKPLGGGALPDKGIATEVSDEAIAVDKVAGKSLLLQGVTLIEYVLLISVVSLVICVAGPPVAEAIQGQFGKVEEVISNGTSGGSGGGGGDFPGGGSGNEQGGGGENPDKPGGGDTGGGTDPEKPGGGNNGGDTPTDPKPEEKRLEGALDLSALYVGKPGSVTARGVSAGATLVYAWSADGSGIDGATGDSWTPGADYVGKGVVVSATDGTGTYSGSISSQSVTVEQLNMTGSVALSPAVAGRVVSATVNGAPNDAVPGYEWSVDGQVVSTTGTWTPGVEHIGKTVTVTVTDTTGVYAGSIGADAVVEQAELTGTIAVAPGEAGVESAAAVDGAPSDAVIELTWKVDGAAIGTGDAVTLPEDSEGKTLVVEGRDKSGIYSGVISVSLVIKADPRVAEAFAVYSADDQSLDFYKRKSVPEVGEVFEGKTVTEVYTGIEDSDYSSSSQVPWNSKKIEILSCRTVDTIRPRSTAYWFYGLSNLNNPDVSNLDTSNVINMRCMFANCLNLVICDVSGFDTAQVTNMRSMFSNCPKLSVLDVSRFNTSLVEDMRTLFAKCGSLKKIDVSGFNTSKVTDMSGMFYMCTKLASLDVSKFDTSNVTDMSGMFQCCKSLDYIDVRKFDTSSVTDLSSMFSQCTKLTALDVSNFDTSSAGKMKSMFANCARLISLDISSFDTSAITDMKSMFYDCYSLQQIKLGNSFKWIGMHCYPPTPSSSYPFHIPNADGKWYNSKGLAFAPEEIPSNVADTYYASKDLLPKMIGSVEISDPVAGRDCTATVSGAPSDAELSYTWYKCPNPGDVAWIEIAGAHGETLPGSEVVASEVKSRTADARIIEPIGSRMYYKVAVSDASNRYLGSIESAFKVATAPAPLSGKVTVTGTPTYGGTLTANVSGVPSDAALSYQWKRDGVVINGSTGQMRSVSSADLGCDLVVEVSDASGKYAGTIKSKTVPAFKKVSWASGTDAEVTRMVEAADAGYIKLTDYWKSGDVRNVKLSAMQDAHGLGDRHDAQAVELVLSDPGHFELADGTKCNFVVIQKDCLNVKGRMNSYNSNIGGWDVAPRRSWCNTTYREALPEGLRPAFKLFKVHTADGAGSNSYESLDYFTLASEVEMYGTAKYSDAAAEAANSQLEYYKEGKAVRKKANGQETWYWLRSSRATGSYAYCAVNASAGADYNNANGTGGLAPIGCI